MRLRRVWYKKTGDIRFISHLDLMRTMTRTITRARIPLWYTEGFNPHPYMTFALPLSLGMESENDSMDLKLEDGMTDGEVLLALQKCAPPMLEFFDITEPVTDPKYIACALFEIRVFADAAQDLRTFCEELLARDSIVVQKLGKKGRRKVLKDIDLKEHIREYSLDITGEGITIRAVLPAGSVTNINPELLMQKIKEEYGKELFYIIRRKELFDKDMRPFR